MFFLAVLCFAAGVLCFYIPFQNLKKQILHLISKDNISSSTSLDEVDLSVPLNNYIQQIKNQIKDQSDRLVFLQKKIDQVAAVLKEVVIILDEEGRLLFHNSQAREIFYLDEHQPTHYTEPVWNGQTPNSVPPLEEAYKNHRTQTKSVYLNEMIRSPDVMDLFQQCLKKKTRVTKDCVFRKKNQYLKSNFQVTALPFFYEKQKTVVLLFYDQTNIKESQQAHIDFVSNVSHELKTPLTAIRGYVEMLIQDLSQKKFDKFEGFLQILLRNCKRMGELIDDLLTLSSLASQVHLEKKRLNTKDITSHVIEQIKPRGRKLHFFFSAPYVMANPRWVELVLHNLVDNACRHTSENSNVHIRWEKMRDRVILKVKDSGEGIPEPYLHRVFERFFRMDPARSREKGGTGVGLALVKQSMEKHGGCVRAVSPKGGGTEFICEFPNA